MHFLIILVSLLSCGTFLSSTATPVPETFDRLLSSRSSMTSDVKTWDINANDNGSNFQRSVISEDEAQLVRRHGNVPPADYFLVAEVLDHILKKDGIPHEYVEELRNAVIKRNFEGPFTALKMNVPENKCEAAQVALQKLKVFPWKGHTFTADQKEGTLILTRNGLDSVSIPIDIQGVAQPLQTMWRAGRPNSSPGNPIAHTFPVSPDPLHADEYFLAALGVSNALRSVAIPFAFAGELKDAIHQNSFGGTFTSLELIIPHSDIHEAKEELEEIFVSNTPENFNVKLQGDFITLTRHERGDPQQPKSIRRIPIEIKPTGNLDMDWKDGPPMGIQSTKPYSFPILRDK